MEKFLKDCGITKYKFNNDGIIDIFEDFNIPVISLKKLPFKFGKINGWFDCSYTELKTLNGAPKIVNGDFYCNNNNLITLKYCPKIVNGSFWADNNNLTSLKGLNLDGITGKIILKGNPDLKLTEKEQLWVTLNPGRLVLE